MWRPVKSRLKKAISATPLFRVLRPRKAHLYCVGTAKSGTTSIKTMFEDQLRAAHEPESDRIIDIIFDRTAGKISGPELDSLLLKRDRRMWLDVDSSQLNFYLLDKLVALFPEAKFLLTIRNPYSWLNSLINHQLARKGKSRWIKFRDFRFRPDRNAHRQEEQVLEEMGLYSLDGYLAYWRHHNQTVIDTVPENRLLIVRTDKITERAGEIAAFAGVPGSCLQIKKSHALKTPKHDFRLSDKIEQAYLDARVKEHCGDLMSQFFPEIKSIKDVSLSTRQVKA